MHSPEATADGEFVSFCSSRRAWVRNKIIGALRAVAERGNE